MAKHFTIKTHIIVTLEIKPLHN